MKNNYLLLAEILRTRRILFGYSLRSLSSQVGISHTELARIENGGRTSYNLATIIGLCNVLQLDFIKLLKITGYLPCEEGEIDEETLAYINSFNKINENDKNDSEYVVLEIFINE